jgi:hydroxymethylpyrimidine/phosphomethylpyrimidine kinase
MSVPRALSIAGSDSGGGAGIQADLKTFAAFGVFGMTAITALTAQNSTGVYGVVEIAPEFVAQQIEVVVTDIGVDAVKTGMLANPAIIEIVAAKVKQHHLHPLVIDPVMISKSGAPLLKPEAMGALKTQLLPLATVVTPNLHEASALTGRSVTNLEEMRDAARALHDLGAPNVIIKGGHLAGAAVDVLFDGTEFTEFHSQRLTNPATHGTG